MVENTSVRLFETAYLELSDFWHGKNYRNSFWRLYYDEGAGACIYSEDVLYRVESQRLFLLPASVRFDYWVDRKHGNSPRHFYIHFDVPGLSGFRLREAFTSPFLLPPNESLENEAVALRERVTPDFATDFALDLRLKSLVFGALGAAWEALPQEKQSRGAAFSAENAAITPALRYIEKNLGEPLRNETLAGLCHLSRDHFIRRFKEATRYPPQNYIMERRIALAAQKLLFSEDSIEKIAVDCGFANRFYFSRMFARTMEVSPAAFRRNGARG